MGISDNLRFLEISKLITYIDKFRLNDNNFTTIKSLLPDTKQNAKSFWSVGQKVEKLSL